MKRPIFVLLLVFVLGEVIAVLKLNIAVFIPVILIMVIIKIITKKHAGVFVMIFLFISLGFLNTNNKMLQRDVAWKLGNIEGEGQGSVDKILKTQYGYNVYLKNALINNRECGNIIAYFQSEPDLKIGNKTYLKGKIQQFEVARNKGNFDSKKYYLSIGITTKIAVKEYYVSDDNYDFLRDKLCTLREYVVGMFSKLCDTNGKGKWLYGNKAGIFSAILMGDKTELDQEIKDLYSLSGIAHILAISGLHIGLIGMFLYSLLRKRFSFATSSALTIAVVTLFAITSGMGIATIRAFVMFVLKLIGEILGRKYDYITAISLSALILLADNPFIIINSGFQMSFCAMITITIIWPKVVYLINIKSKIAYSIVLSLCIGIFMNPVIAYNYFQLPTYSFMLNIIVVPLLGIVVISAIAGSGMGFLSILIGKTALTPGCLILEVYTFLCENVLKIPGAVIVVGKPTIKIIVLYYMVIVFFLFCFTLVRKNYEKDCNIKEMIDENGKKVISSQIILKKQRKFDFKIRLAVVGISILSGFFIYYTPSKGLDIQFMDVGQGDGIFIKADDGTTITIDGGSSDVKNVAKYRMIPCIKASGTGGIDYAVITHADKDHISGIEEILNMNTENGLTIRNLVMPHVSYEDEAYDELLTAAKTKGIQVLYIKEGDTMKLGKVEIKCIHPDGKYISDNRNDYSTVLSLKYENFSALFTGDIPAEIEKSIINKIDNNYTILKVAHHGSKYSSDMEFLKKVMPAYSVISVGEDNSYGHPGTETINKLKSLNSKILRTDLSGEIEIFSKENNMEIDVMKN
ncbi:DNA internalization-related competence protein ComEC/Rec2 [Eubacterium sp. AF15-50]|uniref:DNA internalization-related competence protein ComEC/Rec2 n=1 Tax=unclassified Eubacterium (in: firmicutes) TaxID=2624479 RepID=UPI000E51168F|nr:MULTISPECIES: DNA internalization-related competence protein ComEC/Rec2 [unclassified Eubacterium (in: firmicutes)]RHR71971.1 DNA internalization-related competence protein ComEC/Rec2 [Eubacterium sp. AF16-48]RHR79461.1 DNA internalization-related competence protein ComEC/Rec2 [Eubacterium sp. AF15-50]